jgi:hypothetical protein
MSADYRQMYLRVVKAVNWAIEALERGDDPRGIRFVLITACREAEEIFIDTGGNSRLTKRSQRYIIFSNKISHLQCSRAHWHEEIIGNQVQVLSDPVTVSEESAANAIVKARRRGGR